MCDGMNNTSNDGAMMAAAVRQGPLASLSAQELDLVRRDRHQVLHEVIDALGGVFGPAAVTELHRALNNEYEADGEYMARLHQFAEDNLSLLAMFAEELRINADVVTAGTEAAAAVVDEGVGRYPKAKVPAWAKDAVVATTKAKGFTDRLAEAADRFGKVVERRREARRY